MHLTPRKRILIAAVLLIVGAVGLIAWGSGAFCVNQRFKDHSLSYFLNRYPNNATYYWIDGLSGRQLVALVPSDDFLNSGRACFVFDENGNQVWFFSDSGEGAQPVDRIVDQAIREGAHVTKEELLSITRQN